MARTYKRHSVEGMIEILAAVCFGGVSAREALGEGYGEPMQTIAYFRRKLDRLLAESHDPEEVEYVRVMLERAGFRVVEDGGGTWT